MASKALIPLLVVAMAILSIYSCKSEDEDLTKNCLVANFYDPSSDADTSFVDIRNLSVEFIKDTIIVKLQMANIPPQITFNHDDLPINALSFLYEVIFDVDSNRTRSMGDISLTIAKFKFADGEIDADILSGTQKNVWLNVSATSQNVIASIDKVSISGNTVIYKVPVALNEKLNTITCKTDVVCITYYSTGLKSYRDQIPG